MEPCIPLPLDLEPDDFEELLSSSKDYALMHGAGMRSKDHFTPDGLLFAPFLLLPSSFPRKEFEKAVNLQPILNELIHKVAYDYTFLASTLKSTIEVDSFTRRLFDIYTTVLKEGLSQPVSLGLVRSDIMLETCPTQREEVCCCPGDGRGPCHQKMPYCCWKQVEINTIASGFGWLGPASGVIHRYVLQRLGYKEKLVNIPENHSLQGLARGMLKAWEIYSRPKAVILFIVEDVSYNICDQRFHEFEVQRQNPDVVVIRRTLTDVGRRGSLTDKNHLIIDGREVAVIYFRCGYEPSQYHGELEWEARLMMERSTAIKCPSIQYHLAGTKKVQQQLSTKTALNRFLSDSTKVDALREIFTGLYSLDVGEEGDAAIEQAMKYPQSYVLKPQREGGGNNLYGKDVKTTLQKIRGTKERSAYILMDRIHPPVQKNYIIRPGFPVKFCDVVSELGIFGVVIGDKDKVMTNEYVGHMFRTKLSDADEGGVSAGFGALDSVYLIDH